MEGQACRNLNFLHSFIMGPLPISWSLCSWEVLELRVYRSRQQEMFCTSHSGTPRIYEGPQLLCRAAHVRGLGHCWEMMWCVLRQLNFVCVVHKEEFSLMRASFYFTHHIDSGMPCPYPFDSPSREFW